MKKIILALALSTSFFAYSACESKFDYSSGNYYSVCDNDSSTTINGMNYNTGSTWTHTTKSDNTYSGRDSKGNYYNGDNNTGYYHNSGTGKTCYGKGVTRVCY